MTLLIRKIVGWEAVGTQKKSSSQKPWVLGDFWGDSGWTKYRTRVFFVFIPCFVEFLFSWCTFPASNPFYFLVFTNNSLCSVHLNCFIRRQSLCIQATTTAKSCDQLFNDITMGSCDQTHLESFRMGLNHKRANSRVTLYTTGHLHTAVPHCSHSRTPIVHTAVPQENNEHGGVYLRFRAVCKLPGCVEGHRWNWITQPFLGLIWSWSTYTLYAHVIWSLAEIIYVRHAVNNCLFEVGPLCKGFPHCKNRFRVSRVLTHKKPS